MMLQIPAGNHATGDSLTGTAHRRARPPGNQGMAALPAAVLIETMSEASSDASKLRAALSLALLQGSTPVRVPVLRQPHSRSDLGARRGILRLLGGAAQTGRLARRCQDHVVVLHPASRTCYSSWCS